MLQPQPVVDHLRLALTPVMDGVVMDQEWDLFCDTASGPTFFQWEPETIYWGGKPRLGQDIVLSVDLNGDGWLVGDDNYEVRATQDSGGTSVNVRQLDARDRNGPKWVKPSVLPQSFGFAGKPSSDYWNFEGKFTPLDFGGEIREDSRVGVRVDLVNQGESLGPAYLPRSMAEMRLRFDKSRGLFSGLSWRPSLNSRSIARVDPMKVRFNFQADEDCPTIQAIDIVGEGYARDVVNQVTLPFPQFDSKHRGSVEFESAIKETAPSGYRVLRASVLAADGRIATLRTSVRIADLLDFEPAIGPVIAFSDQPRTVKSSVVLKSQSLGRMEGRFSYRIPQEWSAKGEQTESFLIYHSKGTAKKIIEFVVPGGATGVFPIQFSATVGDTVLTRTVYVTVR